MPSTDIFGQSTNCARHVPGGGLLPTLMLDFGGNVSVVDRGVLVLRN